MPTAPEALHASTHGIDARRARVVRSDAEALDVRGRGCRVTSLGVWQVMALAAKGKLLDMETVERLHGREPVCPLPTQPGAVPPQPAAVACSPDTPPPSLLC